ncbi:type IV secretion system protein [Massilia sp. CCM 9210]|uniref:type IV secretion system protein n=1 Tax=Massilia scottii TaxID=3057166 RepID=UPI002796D23D|nr:type IV secretion system protein [Massilia sp. CCM 9210]MDQ1817822.1 type IV secretion system protein [Massilia sp. CCM 9210]
MDEAAPITWLIKEIDAIVSAGASTVSTGLANGIAPIASACFGIYLILMTLNYLRGNETEPVVDFSLKMASWALIIGFGLNAGNYNSTVAPIVTGLGTSLADIVSGGNVTSGALDTLALTYLKIIDEGFAKAQEVGGLDGIGITLLVAMKATIVILGLVPFLVAATLFIITANVGSQIIAMVGPLFFAFLLFPATRQYFSAWLNTAFSYALIPMIIAVVASISVGLSQKMIPAGSTLDGVPFKTVFLAAVGNLVLLFFVKQVASIASSLSAGGINASMPGSIGTLTGGISSGMKGTAKEMKGAHKAWGATKGLRTSIANKFNSIRKAG